MESECCGQCEGYGYIAYQCPKEDCDIEDSLPERISCEACEGRGFTEKERPEIVCPVCGSVDIAIRQDMRSMNPMGAGVIFIDQVNHYCNVCKASGDFTGENDHRIEAAIQDALTKRAIESLDKLAEQGNTATWIERCLGLEIGFLKRCREYNEFSRETYTLLRFIECQPELLTLAKLGYPPIEKVIARIQCDPGILASSTETISDVGNIVGKGDDWVDIEITDKETIEKLINPKTIPYSMGTKVEFMGVDVE